MTAPTAPYLAASGAATPSSPAFRVAAYSRQQPRWDLCEDLRGETDTMRSRGQLYLPKAPLETEGEYAARLKITPFFSGFAHTTSGLTGMVFRSPPVLENGASPDLIADWSNIDGAGTAGDVFAAQVFEEALAKGHSFIYVDYPQVAAPEAINPAEQKKLQLRPYWIHVKPQQVVSWRTRVEGGLTILAQVVIEETLTEAAGGFGESVVCQYRQLTNEAGVITWTLWKELREGTTLKGYTMEGPYTITGPAAIPLVQVIAGERIGFFETKPALLGLAFTNIAHYQVGGDFRWDLFVTGHPFLVRIGGDKDDPFQAVGANVGINVPIGGDVKWAETTGNALSQSRDYLSDLKKDMVAQGMAMLERTTQPDQTARAASIDKGERDSRLARAARNLEDALEQCVVHHMAYRGGEPAGITLSVDFEHLTLDATTIDTYSRLVDSKKISLETFWQWMREGNALPKDFDPEKELIQIGEETLTMVGGDATPETQPKPDELAAA